MHTHTKFSSKANPQLHFIQLVKHPDYFFHFAGENENGMVYEVRKGIVGAAAWTLENGKNFIKVNRLDNVALVPMTSIISKRKMGRMQTYFIQVYRSNGTHVTVRDLSLQQAENIGNRYFRDHSDCVYEVKCYATGETPIQNSDENCEWVMR